MIGDPLTLAQALISDPLGLLLLVLFVLIPVSSFVLAIKDYYDEKRKNDR